MIRHDLSRRPARAAGLVSVLWLAAMGLASAQFPPPPGQPGPASASPFPPPPGQAQPNPASASPFPPVPGQSGPARSAAPSGPSPFSAPGAGPQGKNPCEDFLPIRQNAEKGAAAIQAAGQRNASREEVCPLFRRFAAAEAQMVKFLVANQKSCGVPPEAVKQARAQHAQTLKIRTQVCSAGPVAPRGPSLSDAFGSSPLPEEPKSGRGTFDTLTGNALSR